MMLSQYDLGDGLQFNIRQDIVCANYDRIVKASLDKQE